MDTPGARALRGYLAGKTEGGMELVATVPRADPRGRLPAKPLDDAIRNHAEQQAVPVPALFTDPRDRATYTVLATRVQRARRGRAPTIAPAVAARLAHAAA